MKSSVLSLVFAAALAAAQDGIPTCATGCVTKFTTGTSIAGCGQLDIECICKNADFLNGIACCLTSACDKDSQAQAVDYAKQICSAAGVSTPDQVVCNESSSSSSSSPSGSTTAPDTSSASTSTSGSETTDSSDSSTTAADTTAADTTSAPPTTTSPSRNTVTTSSQRSSSTTQTSSNVAAPLATAGSFVGAAIAMLAAAI
ncbi:cfem domain-containing [Trichoderma arundinaceum]|uniref:Cfem domain-containing n=1 Tax=Trichoderma arundinaceum TaxID=490622 RepID=A0A395NCQ5_TRIAR|nr:cfem domain-containing [Trichoderma arundinaceum]